MKVNGVFVCILGWSLIFFNAVRAAEVPTRNEKVKLKWGQLSAPLKIPSSSFGIWISDDKLNPVFSLNGDQFYIPASLTKLVTAAAVFDAFPVSQKFNTQLYLKQKNKGSLVEGDLYLKGGGDPGFVSESMWFLVNEFVRSGIREIKGDIIVDESYLDSEWIPEGRDEHRQDRAYDAPVSALSFNWNSINIFIRPGSEVGQEASVLLDPLPDFALLSASVKTIKGHTDLSHIEVSKSYDSKKQKDAITVSGRIGKEDGEKAVFKNITRPPFWAGANLKFFLKQRGVTVSGEVKEGKTPPEAILMAQVESKPLHQIVMDMQKFSNNFVAEMLTKQLGALDESPGNIKNGLKRINEFLKNEVSLKGEFLIESPSGLSRENKITPHQFGQVIRYASRHPRYGAEYLTTLPVAGEDGTLKRRMRHMDHPGQIRAKTGHLAGVTGLAGLVSANHDESYIFVFIYNGPPKNEQHVRDLFDRLAQSLLE